MESLPKVAIIELGSQTTLLIERSLRELSVRSVILDPKRASNWLKKHPVKAVILSGGEASVYDEGAPQPPAEMLAQIQDSRVAILGICYGMQWLANHGGGKIRREMHGGDYGRAEIKLEHESDFFHNTSVLQEVWMSHGDSVAEVPEAFQVTATTLKTGNIAAMQHHALPIYGVQFHPEVTHSAEGKQMLSNFVLHIARCDRDWMATSVIEEIRTNVLGQVGNRRAIFGFSGGVDSTTLSAILAPALKNRLLAITIDGGHLRENELDEIRLHAQAAGVIHAVLDARAEFEVVMADTVDAEEKRRRFKKVYTALFVKVAQDFGAEFVFQGTLAPDRIESGATGGALIKSHHNVGLDMGNLIQLHPIDHLFKYEIRALAKELGLPGSVHSREPFPGPGLFLRVVGTPATPDKLEIVRWATVRTREVLERHNLYSSISQLVVAYIGTNTVGVKGDGRVYAGAIVVRPVETVDFMTAKGKHLPDEVEDEIIEVLTRHPLITRTWFDYTSKPPATTEME